MTIPKELLYLIKEAGDGVHFPPTLVFTEGWMLRIVLSILNKGIHFKPLTFMQNSTWFSEAQLYSPFHRRSKYLLGFKDDLYEKNTHADGVIGHFQIRPDTKTGLKLIDDAKQFIVLEAKIFSELDTKVTNADFYDQASRTVACMAEIIKRTNVNPNVFESTGYYVIVPEKRLELFQEYLVPEYIISTVEKRIEQYRVKKRKKDVDILTEWYDNWFIPLVNNSNFQIGSLSWEQIIYNLEGQTSEVLLNFYDLTLKYNKNRMSAQGVRYDETSR